VSVVLAVAGFAITGIAPVILPAPHDAVTALTAAVFTISVWTWSFAVIGLVLFAIEKIIQFATQPLSLGFGVFVAVCLLLAFITGVRGTFAYHRMKEAALLQQGAPLDA